MKSTTERLGAKSLDPAFRIVEAEMTRIVGMIVAVRAIRNGGRPTRPPAPGRAGKAA